jgi:predicted nucleic acid-binding protein
MSRASIMIVDANVAIYWAVPCPFTQPASRIMSRVGLVVPGIFLSETANALINYARAELIDSAHVPVRVQTIREAIGEIVGDDQLIDPALQLAISRQHKIYDCLYLALALERREPLATADRRMAALARELHIETELIEPE